ncbi:MAG: metallophosphoesterase, partial [Promethearchaeota archaeon]
SGGTKEEWHYLFNSLSLLAANRPFMGVIGNHDWDGGFEKGSNWAGIFSYPYAQPCQGRFYSFDYLNAHFVMMDNFEHAYHMSDAQVQWVEQDLAAARARGQDWLFCFFHLSIFSSYTANMYYDLQETFVPIFDQYGVDAVFYGHDHAYEHYAYRYGWNGLLHDPSHASWNHKTVHYFLTGGGGAALEYEYGVTKRAPETFQLEWYDANAGSWTTKTYERRPWNPARLMNNTGKPGFEPAPNGLQFYQDPREEVYQDDVVEYGFQYGENTLHYIKVEVNGATCTISVHYPNGQVLTGPRGDLLQTFVLTK